MQIKVEHKGQDYYGIQVDNEYIEVSLEAGEAIKKLLATIKVLLKAKV